MYYSDEQRQLYIDQICEMVREWIGNGDNDFELGVQRGVEWQPEVVSGNRRPRANPSLTLTLRINGGAHDTEGQPIVAAPRVFKGRS
jgi:hypothetical protein